MGYQLASDEDFSPLITEICELMRKKTGADIINNAGKLLSSSGAAAMFSFDNADDAYSQLNNYIEEKIRSITNMTAKQPLCRKMNPRN